MFIRVHSWFSLLSDGRAVGRDLAFLGKGASSAGQLFQQGGAVFGLVVARIGEDEVVVEVADADGNAAGLAPVFAFEAHGTDTNVVQDHVGAAFPSEDVRGQER